MFQTIPASFALLTMIRGRRSRVDDSRRSPTDSLNYVVSLYDHCLVLFLVVCGKNRFHAYPPHWCENVIFVLVQIALRKHIAA